MKQEEIFKLAEILAGEVYGEEGFVKYSERQDMTIRFDKILKKHLMFE